MGPEDAAGGRSQRTIWVIETDDPAILTDIDMPEEYLRRLGIQKAAQ
jgi:hypothetical protein